MNVSFAHNNLLLAWAWVLLGFISGAMLGMRFNREDWLGGYGSFRRRMYRLGHISFFGLAIVNSMFYFTAQALPSAAAPLFWASQGFMIGAITMPVCCLIMAYFPKAQALFAIPVLSLLAASGLTIWSLIKI